MSETLLITVPASAASLRDELEQRLAPYADVMSVPPASFDLQTVQLIVDITAGAVGVLKTLLEIKKLYEESRRPSSIVVGRPGEPGIPLEHADELFLRRLLGITEA